MRHLIHHLFRRWPPVIAMVLLAVPAQAQPLPDTPGDIVAAALVAGELGRDLGDPNLLIGAAAALLAPRPGSAIVTPPTLVALTGAGAEPVDLAAGLLDQARFLARGDAGLLGRIARLDPGIAAPALTLVLPPSGRLSFRAEPGPVPVTGILAYGLGRGDLDLRVTDAAGRTLCEDVSPRDQAGCAFAPARAPFIIEITNAAPEDHAALLVFF